MFNIFCANIFAHLVQPHIAPDSYHRSALDSNITYNLKAVKEHFFFSFLQCFKTWYEQEKHIHYFKVW